MKKLSVALTGAGATALLLLGGAGVAHASSRYVPFKSAGSGAITGVSGAGCQNTPGVCTVVSSGSAISSHLGSGTYTSQLTIDWSRATLNGTGGFCAPIEPDTSNATLTAANGDELNLSESGTVCEVGPTGYNIHHTFTGTFAITGGTGRFAYATGNGTVTGGDDGLGHSFYQESGTISY